MNLRDDFVADYHGAPFEVFGRAHLLSLALRAAPGPWPFDLVPMIGIGILNCISLYVPFAIVDRRSPSS